ncbi:UNVERIFIED_ORG: putative peptide zinc metalloprotease protein [Arthrobacter globiformis]|nr:putative peptide zinc metalloprotease protein [Arthrobacter globiformis]
MSAKHSGPSGVDGPPVSPTPTAGPAPSAGGTAAAESPTHGTRAAVVISRDTNGEVPVRAAGIQLIGEAKGSGYREAPSLVRRADGQTIQLTRLLFHVLEAIDGVRDVDGIAEVASTRSGRLITGDNARTLIEGQLLPLGLLQLADGSQPEVRRSDPLLGMRFRYTVTDPERTRKLTAPFAVLFNPLIVAIVAAGFLASCWWVLLVKGLASATHDAFANPWLLLLIFAVTVLSAGFHEFGHAAAARRGGATPGAMGAGLYLVWPAFYTDVTDSYRLGRGGRLRTDMGGLYFNAIVAIATMGVWWATGFDALLLVVLTQILQMVRQLLPLVRFDGYHILADATGVPDLFQRIRPTLLGMLPWRWGKPEPQAKALKPWARAVITVWVLVTVPLLLLSLVLMVVSFPRLLGTAWASLQHQQALLSGSLADGNFADGAVRVLAIAAVVLPVVGVVYMLVRLARQLIMGLWTKTRGRPLQRATALAAVGAVAASLAWAWWPLPDSYRPVQPYERGTLADATAAVYPATGGPDGALHEGRTGQTVALWPDGTKLPTREQPQLSMVLVPRQGAAPASAAGQTEPGQSQGQPGPDPDQSPGTATGDTTPPSWVFPFDKPPAPEEDGNQALAVNTTDGSVRYDIAFALVWAEDGPVDTRNEAYAFASCTDCAAVAVGFQVVLIVGQADVVVPENLSAAANYNCVRCLTYALASQLVLTLDGPLSTDGMARLNALWQEIAEFGRTLQGVPLSEIEGRLGAYKEQLMEIIRTDPSAKPQTGTGTPSPGSPPSPGASGGSDPGSGSQPGEPTPGQPAAPGVQSPGATSPGAPSPGTTPDPAVPAPGTGTTPVPTVPSPAPTGAAPAATDPASPAPASPTQEAARP